MASIILYYVIIVGLMHNCVNWSATPPVRRTPLLVLSYGDDHVYTIVPKALKTLEQVARKEFDLGDAIVQFSSPCANLCHGKSARITQDTWEVLSPYIGCATIAVVESRPQGVASDTADVEDSLSIKRNLAAAADKHENDHTQALDGTLSTSVETDIMSDHGNDRKRAPTSQAVDPGEEEATVVSPHGRRPTRNRDNEESERVHDTPWNFPFTPPLTQQDDQNRKLRQTSLRLLSELQSTEPLGLPDSPIKQVKHTDGGGSNFTHTEQQYEAEVQTPIAFGESQKLTIRVAHRPSNQEAKFMTKASTSAGKVLVSACRSFGLDANLATLHLVVIVEDEDGPVENLFPCDRKDTIVRAGAERDTESKFLIKIAGEA